MAPMTGVLGVGLMGASVTFLVLSNVAVAMLLSRRQVQLIFCFTVAVMPLAAVGCASGILARAQAQMPTVIDSGTGKQA